MYQERNNSSILLNYLYYENRNVRESNGNNENKVKKLGTGVSSVT